MNHVAPLALFDVVLRSDLQAFVEKAFQIVYPNDKYLGGWHADAICWHLHLVRSGEMPCLIINAPPRSLKSFIVSVAWPAFILGHDPGRRIVCVSYSDDLAAEHARLFRLLIRSKFYRRLFPQTRVGRSKDTVDMVVTTRNGFRMATSIGGTLTGKGGQLIIIDDPIKAEGANSASDRKRVIDWYSSTSTTRLDDPPNGQMVLVMQRVHAFDLSGHLLALGGWGHLSLQAECRKDVSIPIGPNRMHRFEEAALLHEARLPRHVLEARYKELGSAQFSAQYLQDPVPPDGTIVKRSWFRYFDPRMAPRFIEIIQSWDVAAKIGAGNDWSVCVTLGIAADGYYVIDVVRLKVEFPDLLRAAIGLFASHRPSRILVEQSSSGIALLQSLDRATRLNAIGIRPQGDKEARVHGVSAMFEAGKVKFPRGTAWLPEHEREWVEFPNGQHDDQVDALTHALAWARDNADFLVEIVGPVSILKDETDRFFRDEDFGPLDADDMIVASV